MLRKNILSPTIRIPSPDMRRDSISRIHADLRDARRISRGATMRPEDVATGHSKAYPRMPRILLPEPIFPNITLHDALQARSSRITKEKGAGGSKRISLDMLSALLSSIGMNGAGSRTYPSGGRLYPIDAYFIGSIPETDEIRAYHYDPKQHALEDLWALPEQYTMFDIFGSLLEENVPLRGALIFSATWERISAKYGDFSYILGLLEAGHIAQNILLTACALQIGARPMGGFNDAAIGEMLDIDGDGEQAVYAIALV